MQTTQSTAATVNKINAAIAKHGVEVVKGGGYFYFAAIREDAREDDIPSVFSMTLRCMTLQQWIDHVETSLNN